jgi:hypothetical protein
VATTPLHRAVTLAIIATWVQAGVKTLAAFVQSSLYTVAFHERGLETATSVVRRRQRVPPIGIVGGCAAS